MICQVYNYQKFEFQGDGCEGSTPPYNGNGALAGSGTTWNLLSASKQTVSNALDSNGNASSVGFTAGLLQTVTLGNNGNSKNTDQLLTNFADTTAQPQDIHFSGLADNAAFTLDLYGVDGGDAAYRGTIFMQTNSTYTTV